MKFSFCNVWNSKTKKESYLAIPGPLCPRKGLMQFLTCPNFELPCFRLVKNKYFQVFPCLSESPFRSRRKAQDTKAWAKWTIGFRSWWGRPRRGFFGKILFSANFNFFSQFWKKKVFGNVLPVRFPLQTLWFYSQAIVETIRAPTVQSPVIRCQFCYCSYQVINVISCHIMSFHPKVISCQFRYWSSDHFMSLSVILCH
jgi:hypothetical protein